MTVLENLCKEPKGLMKTRFNPWSSFKKQLLRSILAWDPFEIFNDEDRNTHEIEIRLREYLLNITA
jgi:hypothetical protein